MQYLDQDKLVKLLEKQTAILERLAVNKEASEGSNDLHTKAPANFSTFTPLHGVGGVFAVPGLERDIVTAHVRPRGLASRLAVIPTVYTNPLYGAITGFTDVIGTEPTFACQDAPSAYMKTGTLTAKFGMLRRDSQTIDIDDVMLRLHRGDFTDLVLRGQLLGLTNLNPTGTTDQNQVLNVVSASEMVNVGVQIERALNKGLWQSTATGVIGPGLDSQIATGQKDAITGALLPSLDSDVKSFNYDLVGGTGRDIVEYLSMIEFYLRYNAEAMGLLPVVWVVVMRPELWFELSSIWPCKYSTTKCATSVSGMSNVSISLNGRENVAERDAMRNGMYIDINGNRYEVVLDTGIYERNNVNDANLTPGTFASSIYFVPLSAAGMPVTYREHVDYRQAQADYNLTQGKLDVWWTDNGLYNWSLTQEKWCYKFHVKTEQRVILRTPHLAGKIDRIQYSPLQHLRDSDPTSPYWVNGGVSLRANAPAYQAVWMT